MNEVLKAIATRYSCRDFSPEKLKKEDVSAIVNAALAAPSAMNMQPWHVIVVEDKALIEEMDTAAMEVVKKDEAWYKRMVERGGKIFYDAPCVIFIASDGTKFSTLDSGIVSQNIALAAHSLGLGSVICAMANIPLTSERGDEFKRRIKLPEGFDFGMAVCVGAAKSGKEPHELNPTKVTYI